MSSFIGIDLGTTFSAVATIDPSGRPTIVHNSEGSNITASCVAEIEPNKFEVGEFARRTWGLDHDKAAARFKREMGSSKTFSLNGEVFTPTELSAMVLKKLAQDAKSTLDSIGSVVVTVPANFSHEARDATMAAAKSAGLNVEYIINEPTAAALYYAFKSGEDLSGNYAVFDLGGGTFDVSIVRVDGHEIEVLASNGVSRLGGDDFDKALQKLVIEKFNSNHEENIDERDFTINDTEEEKKSLSKRGSVAIQINRKLVEVTREEFEEAISTLVAQTEMLCESAIEEAGVRPEDIRQIFLAGGSTRIPAIQESVRRVFRKDPVASANVDEVVALGAALYAAYKGDREHLTEVQKSSIDKIKVSECTSRCFGTISMTHDMERDQSRFKNSVLIYKGQKIPCSVTESFYTIYDDQDSVRCQLTESTAPETDPKFVKIVWEGELELLGNRPSGQEIEITYQYDENQMIKCSFVDKQTGNKKEIELSMTGEQSATNDIEKFLVE